MNKRATEKSIYILFLIIAALILSGCSSVLSDDETLNTEGKSGSFKSLVTTDLKTALSNGKPTVAEFGSDSCIPCKEMQPILAALSLKYEGRVNIVFIEVYENSDLAGYFQIRAIPTQVFFDNIGKPVTSHIGFFPESEIIAQLVQMGVK